MAKYCLSINILSNERELLDKLMLTLETQDGDMTALEGVEIQTEDRGISVTTDALPESVEQGVALEHWFLPEGL